METLIGQPNESTVTFCGVDTTALIDSGSEVTTVCEEFLATLTPPPRQVPLEDLRLNLEGPDGRKLPYSACIEASVKMSFCPEPITILALVVPTTRYNSKVPVLVGTNVINRVQESCPADKIPGIPTQWQNAFVSMQSGFVGVVKSTNRKDIKIQPLQTVTVSGLVRKQKEVETAITENTEAASSRIGVCPRLVSLDQTGQNQRVSVRVFNISAKTITVQPKTPLCQLQEVKVLRHADIGLEEPKTLLECQPKQLVMNMLICLMVSTWMLLTCLKSKRNGLLRCSASGTVSFPRT